MNKKSIKALEYSKIKELIHPLLLKILSSKTTGNLKVEGNFPSEGNYLIVANHLCIEDIPTLGQAVKRHFYLMVSDEDKNTIDGLALGLNGVEWVHRIDKNSRVTASNHAIEILKSGKSFAMYPESTWNLSPNLLLLPMNYGCIRIALEANVPIIPVVSFFTEDGRKTIIGKKFYPTNNLIKSITDLRDEMATMLYKEFESNSYNELRKQYNINFWNEYVNNKYNAYKRARDDKQGVREFESQFIYTSKEDSYFQVFNSVIKETSNGIEIKRISSENNGYNEDYLYDDHFGYGYNEEILKRELKK